MGAAQLSGADTPSKPTPLSPWTHTHPTRTRNHTAGTHAHNKLPPHAPPPTQPRAPSYRVSGSHANPLAIKTDAPPGVVWDIVRCWVRQHPVREPDPNSYAGRLLAKEPKLEADFSRAPGSVPKSQAAGVARFVQNPAYWGPKSRHGSRLSEQQARARVRSDHGCAHA